MRVEQPEGSGGNWITNLFNWLIGFVIFYIWILLGFIFAFFAMWQVPLEGMTGVYESFAPAGVSTMYTDTMSVGGK